MAMAYGRIKMKNIRAAIEWIKNRGLVFTGGLVNKSTRDILEMILGKIMESFIGSTNQGNRP